VVREILNTLYVTHPQSYVRLENDTVRVELKEETLGRVPLHHLGSIVLMGAASISPKLLERCAEDGRSVTLLDHAGRFKCRIEGKTSGNVLLRKAQYETFADPERGKRVARNFVAGKIRNSRRNLLRGARETRRDDDREALRSAADALEALLGLLPEAESLDDARGIEGRAAAVYFDAFGAMITAPSEDFSFRLRSRRPPKDRVNALLSFLYALLTQDCVSACEGTGLDPQFGFLHALRPGRPSLALDLMEEFRPSLADRLALTLINRRQLKPEHFDDRPGGSVLLNDEGRKLALTAYQTRKQEETPHLLVKERVPMGLVPHLQARLLARHLRGDLNAYPPFVGG
jgi:CRISPR-associated protein Cas1